MNKTDVFDRLYRQHYQEMYFFARQFLEDKEVCHDIVTSVFEDVWKNIDKISQMMPKASQAYLFTTTRNRCLNQLRHEKAHQRYVEFCMHISDYCENPEKLAQEIEQQHEIDKRINELQPPTREIFIACYVDRKKYKEVSKEMNISISTVRKHIVKALKIFKEKNKKE